MLQASSNAIGPTRTLRGLIKDEYVKFVEKNRPRALARARIHGLTLIKNLRK